MQNRVYSQELVDRVVDELKITDLEQATIGQVVLLASRLEELTGIPFIRMDQGVPGLEPCRIGTEAEKQALDTWIPAIYPAAEGIPELKTEASRFVKAFLDVDISAAACVPVTGRTHQIRVHMKAIGHPLLGDFLYNPDYRFIGRQALHSYTVAFRHPITGEAMEFSAPMPEDFSFFY